MDTKSGDKKTTLMHFLVQTVQDKFPELLNFDSELRFLDKAALGRPQAQLNCHWLSWLTVLERLGFSVCVLWDSVFRVCLFVEDSVCVLGVSDSGVCLLVEDQHVFSGFQYSGCFLVEDRHVFSGFQFSGCFLVEDQHVFSGFQFSGCFLVEDHVFFGFQYSGCVFWWKIQHVFFGILIQGVFWWKIQFVLEGLWVLGSHVQPVICSTQLLCNQNCFPVSSVVGSVSVPAPLSHSVMSIPVHL